MKIFVRTLFLLILSSTVISAQTRNSVICFDKQLWFINDTQAVDIGGCGKKTWSATVSLENLPPTRISERLNKKEDMILKSLQTLSKDQFKPILISETNLEEVLRKQSNKNSIVLNSTELPPFVKDFLEPNMEFIIVRGISGGGEFIEKERFTINISSANPTLKEMLDEVRKVYSDREDVKEYGEFYYFENYNTGKRMEDDKTAADYNLKSGDKLILTFDYARYNNLPPGVRGGEKRRDN